MYVAERALNRELTKTNHELRNQLHLSQKKFLDFTSMPDQDLEKIFPAETFQEVLKVNRENSFLREKLNRFLGKPDVSATRVVSRESNDEARIPVPRLGLPAPKTSKMWAGGLSKSPLVPSISREIAMKLVLHEVKRLSGSFVALKQNEDFMRSQLAEECAQNEQITLALDILQERFLEKEKGLVSLHRILLDKFGKNKTNEIFQSLDRAGWCNLFSNSILQFIDPPTTAINDDLQESNVISRRKK